MGVRCEPESVNRCVATAGVPVFIDRNLGMLKIRLSCPTRSDQYRAGPREVSLTRMATSNIGSASTRQAATATKMSKKRFMIKIGTTVQMPSYDNFYV